MTVRIKTTCLNRRYAMHIPDFVGILGFMGLTSTTIAALWRAAKYSTYLKKGKRL